MADFHDITVKEVRKETNDCSSILFDVPKYLWQDFDYKSGQHLIFKKDVDGEEIRRTYSLCSNPYDNEWRVCVKQIPDGVFSTFVNQELRAGDTLQAMSPTGKFGININPEAYGYYVFFAAGSGITPIISMLKTYLQKEPTCRCQLFYLNKRSKTIVFKEELEQLRNTYFGRFELFHILSDEQRDIELFNGFSTEKLQIINQNLISIGDITNCFICGPEELTFTIRDEMVKAGLAKSSVHYELFVTGLSEEDKNKAAQAMENMFDGTKVTVLQGGKETKFVMTEDYDNVLDAALAAGADVPFACKGGVCSTCKCQVEEGSVEMKKNYALEEDELENNFILSCQSVPTSEKLKVNYDV